jgi:hypothetical protein
MSDYKNQEPPCGWRKLEELFIQKSAYLTTHVDWDSEAVKFEYLAQIIDYGKIAISECIGRSTEAEKLKAEHDALIETFELLLSEIKDEVGGEYDDGEWFALDKARIAVSEFKSANFFAPMVEN